ncbi:MAG: hypothetical protein JW726_19145 [Anaerolineales bacterium]|nr:hypothetical protein [Anaerolineales bacterium]
MTIEDNESQQLPAEDSGDAPEVYSVSKEGVKKPKLTRRNFVEIAAASAAALAVGGAAAAGRAQKDQSLLGAIPATGVYLFASPGLGQKILEAFHEGDLVLFLGRNHQNTWSQVKSASGNIGWVQNQFLDFTHPVYQKDAEVDTKATALTLNALYFVDAQNGWGVGESGAIARVMNDGEYYDAQVSNTAENLNAVFFTDANNGWAVGNNGTIVHTNDGGSTWTPQTSNTLQHLICVFFLDNNNGWAAGGTKVVQTSDGGQNWTELPDAVSSSTIIQDIHFFDANNGVLVAYQYGVGELVFTTDGGSTWTPATCDIEDEFEFGYMQALHFITPLLGIAAGGFVAPSFFKSTDSGHTWTFIPCDVAYNPIFDVQMVDTEYGFALGTTGLMQTTNGAGTWEELFDAWDFKDMCFISRQVGYVITSSDLGMFKSTDGGHTWLPVPDAPPPTATPTPHLYYLPIIVRQPTPTPTNTNTPTPTATATICTCDAVCGCDGHCGCDGDCLCDKICTCDTIHYWYPN